jgi:hypothetical protein
VGLVVREISDRDVYATARLLVRRHGRSAGYFAAGRADERRRTAKRTWRRLVRAAEVLQDDALEGKSR